MKEEIKRLQAINKLIIDAMKGCNDYPNILLWLSKEDAEMLHHWLNNKILWEQTYGKEGTP